MDTFTALAEPTRRTIVEMLARSGPLSATEISEQFSVSPPAISQHLKVLREAKVVLREKRAQQRLYQLNPDALGELEAWARHMTHLWKQRFDALERVVEAEKKHTVKHEMETPIVSAALAGVEEGGTHSLDRLAEHLG
jgi:DNA-binding transcriptional ArsR family regulator